MISSRLPLSAAAMEKLASSLARLDGQLRKLDELQDGNLPAVAELQDAVEELRVAEEELHAQNDALRVAYEVAEFEHNRYLQLFDDAPDACLITDFVGVILDANISAERMLGAKKERLHRKPLSVFVPLEQRAVFRNLLVRLQQSAPGEPIQTGLRLQPRHAPAVETSTRIVVAESDGGRTIRWNIRDDTTERELERARRFALRERAARRASLHSLRRLRFLYECGLVSAQQRDPDRLPLEFARAATRFFADGCDVYLRREGWLEPVAQLCARNANVQLLDAMRARLGVDPKSPAGPLALIMAGRELIVAPPLDDAADRSELFLQLKQNLPREALFIAVATPHETIGALAFYALRSHKGFGAEEVGAAVESASRLGAALEHLRLLKAAQSASRARSEFLATMSHELRTPLTAVVGYTDLLLAGVAGELPPTAIEWLERIRSSAEHQAHLVNDVLTYVRDDPGPAPATMQSLDAALLAEEAANVMRPAFDQAGTKLFIKTASVRITTDPDRVRQILLNLLGNALKFTPQGTVTLEMRVSREQVIFGVSDTGVGIAPEHLEKIFDAFWQVDQSDTRRFGGAGLGLAVSRRLATQLRGTLIVSSTLGAGSTFTLSLPV